MTRRHDDQVGELRPGALVRHVRNGPPGIVLREPSDVAPGSGEWVVLWIASPGSGWSTSGVEDLEMGEDLVVLGQHPGWGLP